VSKPITLDQLRDALSRLQCPGNTPVVFAYSERRTGEIDLSQLRGVVGPEPGPDRCAWPLTANDMPFVGSVVLMPIDLMMPGEED
jgi:hypothetical protein